MSAALVRIERHGEGGHVAELVLDRPEAMNAVSTEMARALTAATAELAQDRDVRAVVVSSSHPRGFCVGADLQGAGTFDRSSCTTAVEKRRGPCSSKSMTVWNSSTDVIVPTPYVGCDTRSPIA